MPGPCAKAVSFVLKVYFETAFRFCSDLVDLVVCVDRHGCSGHRLALAGERFCLGDVRGGGGWPARLGRWYQEQPLLRRPRRAVLD